MKKKKKLLSLALMAFVTSHAWGGCTVPAAPASIPDGRKATKDEMMSTKKEVDRFKKEAEAYLACEINDSKQQLVQTQLERVATKFNTEVRNFKAASTGS